MSAGVPVSGQPKAQVKTAWILALPCGANAGAFGWPLTGTQWATISLPLVCSLLFLPNLGHRPLNSSHEARAAQNAATMLADGDWTLPVLFDHQVDLQKPPLYYWLVALCASITGQVDAFTVRLPAALSALGCIGVLLLLGWRTGRPRVGLVAGWLLATSVQFHHLAGVARIDMPLTLAVTLALAAFYLAQQTTAPLAASYPTPQPPPRSGDGEQQNPTPQPPPRSGEGEQQNPTPLRGGVGGEGGPTPLTQDPPARNPSPQPPPRSGDGEQQNPTPQPPPRSGDGEPESPTPLRGGVGEGLPSPWLLLLWLSLAAGVLLKGPIALALAVAVMGAGWLVERWLRQRLRLAANRKRMVLGLWWGLPLLLLVALPWFVIVNQLTHGALFEVFVGHHNFARALGSADALATHPWWYYFPVLLLALAPWSIVLPLALFGRWRDDPLARFGLIWFGAMVLLLSCASFKRADYLLPAIPGALLFLSCLLERWWRTTRRRQFLALTLVGLSLLVPVLTARTASEPDVAAELAAQIRARTTLPVILFRVEDHALAFHLGRPQSTVLEWENLAVWLQQREPYHIVLRDGELKAWPHWLNRSRLVEVLRFHCDTARCYIVYRLAPR